MLNEMAIAPYRAIVDEKKPVRDINVSIFPIN